MNKPTILLYDPALSPWAVKLKTICAIRGFRLHMVEASQLDQPLLALLEGSARESRPGAALPEPVLVFCHLTAPQLDHLLPELGKLGARGCLKAMLTPTNKNWTLRQLYAELCREREAIAPKA